jgi:hypothetical protein
MGASACRSTTTASASPSTATAGSRWTHRERTDAGPRTATELHAALRSLFAAAFHNGVTVNGGWTVRNGPGFQDLDVHVTRVEKPEDGDAKDGA